MSAQSCRKSGWAQDPRMGMLGAWGAPHITSRAAFA